MTPLSVQQLFDLTDKVALVTGAAGHLGRAFTMALAEVGARVIAASRHAERATAIAAKLPDPRGVGHMGIAIDHMDERSIRRGVSEAVEQTGRIDVLVNNGHESLGNDWTDVTAEQFTRQMANATGYFLLAREVHDLAISRNAGASIVMIGSMYGMVGSYPDAYQDIGSASPAAYHALKGGVIHLTRHLAVYWARDRVRVNCLSPGPFPSDDT
ncbi:MAG: SDR family NAD(P)-dependent oxidoreductase, partial [Pirellulales bacterium]|nr:SDR family NAD(P)-dependent oxidoreductase [Pirellulales bacterium]